MGGHSVLFRVRVVWLMFLGLRIVGTEWGNESERYYCCYCSYFSMYSLLLLLLMWLDYFGEHTHIKDRILSLAEPTLFGSLHVPATRFGHSVAARHIFQNKIQ